MEYQSFDFGSEWKTASESAQKEDFTAMAVVYAVDVDNDCGGPARPHCGAPGFP
jgi:hypothetical protein